MADDLSLLFKLKAQNQASPVIHGLQGDVSKLKQQFGSDFGQMQGIATNALGKVTQSLTQVGGQLPVIGNVVNNLTGQFGTMATATEGASAGLAGMAGPAAAAVVGIGLTISAVSSLTQALFGMAQQSAEFQGKLFDLSQQTGVNVETLSALEILAKTTGGSIESISQSLVVFQGKLADAQDGTSKTGKQFRDLGIETENTEAALRQALTALSQMPEGFEQTNTAAELFGRRGGKQLLAILKESKGDLDAAIDRFRELGVLISTADAKAADEFNDQLALLQFQIRSVTATIGKEVVPVAAKAIEDLSKTLRDNKDAIDAVAAAASVLANLITGPLKGAIFLATSSWQLAKPTLELIAEIYERIARAIGFISGTDISKQAEAIGGASGTNFGAATAGIGNIRLSATGGAGTFRPGGRSGSGRGASSGKTDAEREAEQQLAYFTKLAAELGNVTNQYLGVNTATREYEVTQSILNGVLSKAAKGLQEEALYAAVNIDRISAQLKVKKEAADFQEKINAAIKVAIEGERSYLGQAQDVVDALERQGVVVGVLEERWLQLNAGLLQALELGERLPEIFDEVGRALGAIDLSVSDEGVPNIGKIIEDQIGLPPPDEEKFDAWKDAFRELNEIGTAAMQDLAFGVGDLVQQWILMGTIGPNAVRKMAASVIAGVAAQAAVKAVFELAQGFAALFTNPAEAAAHFTSAAIFGSIAGVAAGAGRLIAGGAFQQAGAAGTSGTGTRSTSTASGKPTTFETDRRNVATPTQNLVLKIQPPNGWVGEEFRKDYLLNGVTRLTIVTDGGS